MVDIAENNACIIFHEKHPANDVRRQDQHYNFLKSFAYRLESAYIQSCIQNSRHLSTSAKETMKLLGCDTNILCGVPTEVILFEKKKRCSFCPSHIDQKTRHYCPKCDKSVSNDHRSYIYARYAYHKFTYTDIIYQHLNQFS